jgi:hypothetical protein
VLNGERNQHRSDQSCLETPRRPVLHFLAGARPTDLLRILWLHGGVSPSHALEVALMAASALARTPGCLIESLRVAERVKDFVFEPAPVFIVGHWRSGTTFLHNLMSRDPRFCFPTITDVARPFDFYPNPAEPITRWLVLRLLPPTRPMDDVPLEAHLPQEDEIATATMGVLSFFNCFYFPRRLSEVFAQEVLFEGVSDQAIDSWGRSLRYFLAKLGALSPGKRLLLKNPAHSARIGHLRVLFPGAKFIHIHRHPFEVLRSTQRLYRSLLPLLALQRYEDTAVDDHIVWSYPELMRRLLDSLDELAPGDVIAVSYDELVADPMTTLERIYRLLALGDFSPARGSIQQAACQAFHRRNSICDLDEAARSRLASRWRPLLDRLGYSDAIAEKSRTM